MSLFMVYFVLKLEMGLNLGLPSRWEEFDFEIHPDRDSHYGIAELQEKLERRTKMTPKKRARDEAEDKPCKFLKIYLEAVSYHRAKEEELMRAYYEAVDDECEAMGYPGMPFLSSESLSILPTEMEDTVSQRTENNNETIPRIENELKQDTVALDLESNIQEESDLANDANMDMKTALSRIKELENGLSKSREKEKELQEALVKSTAAVQESGPEGAASLHAKVAELEQTDSAEVIAALNAKVAELEQTDSGKVIAALHEEIAELKALYASELLKSNDDIDLEEEEEEEAEPTSSQDSKKSAIILLLKYLIKLLGERVGSEYKDKSEEEKRAFGTVTISGVEIAKPLYDAWMEYIPANGVTNFIMANPECVEVVNKLFYEENEFAMPYMGEIGEDFNIGFIGSFNLKKGSVTYGTISEFIEPFSNFITKRRPPSSSRNAKFDVGFIILNLCNRLLPSQALTDLNTVKQYMKNRLREGNEGLYELWDKLLPLLKDMNQSSERVHKQLLPVLLKQIKEHNKSEEAVNCAYEFYSEKAVGIFNDASSIYTAVEEAQGGSIPIGKTNHLCSGGLNSGNQSKDTMEQARDTITMMMQEGMTTDHQSEYTTEKVQSILEEKNDAGITYEKTFCSLLKFDRETTDQYRATVNQRKLENKERREMLGIATASTSTDAKTIYIAKDLNEPIRISTVKEDTDELVKDHADVCKKKGEEDKEVDREYIRKHRILKRLNTRTAVYRGGPRIADSEEKLKSNLAPNEKDILSDETDAKTTSTLSDETDAKMTSTLSDETDAKTIYIAKDLNEPIRISTVKEYTDELVKDHADVCKKKGEEDKEVDREYIRRSRILNRLNTRSAVYQGGPRIADSEEKLKSNLAPNKKDIQRDETDAKTIYIAKDLNEPIRVSTVKEYTDELVKDHADVCKKKGEEDKEVDREHIRRSRILNRLNTKTPVYQGGPRIADSEEKLKSNLAPDATDQDNSLGGIRAEDINVNDVLCGRGPGNASRPGNQAYQKLVKEKKNGYKSAKKNKDKASIVEEVLDTIRKKNPPGRFLKKCTDSERYTELSDSEARRKVTQSLGEKR